MHERKWQDQNSWLLSLEQHLVELENFFEIAEIKQFFLQLQQLRKPNSATEKIISHAQADVLRMKAREKGNQRTLWKKFRQHFGISRYANLPEQKFTEAMDWLENFC